MANVEPDYEQKGEHGETKVKIICLGDSAVGKSKYDRRLNLFLAVHSFTKSDGAPTLFSVFIFYVLFKSTLQDDI